jgi:hypothetical protein
MKPLWINTDIIAYTNQAQKVRILSLTIITCSVKNQTKTCLKLDRQLLNIFQDINASKTREANAFRLDKCFI